jgi:cytochrome c553
MTRCTRKNDLDIHHKRRDGGNGLDNAEVLCRTCHVATGASGGPDTLPPVFDQYTKYMAQIRAGYQCECMRTGGCH